MNAKKLFLAGVFSLAFSNALVAQKEYPIKIPSIVDGTPFGLNGHEIKKMLFIIKKIEKIVYGSLDTTTKQRRGRYVFQGQYYSVEELAEAEDTIKTLDKNAQKELYTLLEESKEDFIKINEPYMDQAQSGKLITLKFMDEWATKHGREDTQLLTWAKEKPGHEFDSFREKATSFELFRIFCEDLISFLSDLIKSCPRGWKQFIELQKKRPKPTT